jgi:catechol 2,3-dioxygenase-like lactoylglutathione lyase family enzyme
MKLKPLDHVSLAVSDIDLSIAFYAAAFGYEVVFIERDMAKEIRSMTGVETLSCHLAQLARADDGPRLELIEFTGHALPAQQLPLATGCGHVGFVVDDLDDALREVIAAKAEPIGSITVFPEGRSTYCRAPGGSFFELLEMKES